MLRFLTAGESHGKALVVIVEGLPAGMPVTSEEISDEETGLVDLEPWPDAAIRHVVIVDVPAGNGEPAHQHADIRYFMATRTPDQARAEHEDAPLRWMSLTEAREMTSEPNLRETLARLERLLAP